MSRRQRPFRSFDEGVERQALREANRLRRAMGLYRLKRFPAGCCKYCLSTYCAMDRAVAAPTGFILIQEHLLVWGWEAVESLWQVWPLKVGHVDAIKDDDDEDWEDGWWAYPLPDPVKVYLAG